MSKAIIVTDFAYKGLKRVGRGTGPQGLKATLKYLQYRDRRNNHLAQNRDYERWQDRGLGVHYGEIFQNCDDLQSPHVLAWTWVISPAPDLMELVSETERRTLVLSLTEQIVEEYYTSRGFDIPEYSFVLHDRQGTSDKGEPMQHLHTHVSLPGTAPLVGCDRQAVYNNKEKGHDALFREIGSRHFAAALDDIIGQEWRQLREDVELEAPKPPILSDNFDDWLAL